MPVECWSSDLIRLQFNAWTVGFMSLSTAATERLLLIERLLTVCPRGRGFRVDEDGTINVFAVPPRHVLAAHQGSKLPSRRRSGRDEDEGRRGAKKTGAAKQLQPSAPPRPKPMPTPAHEHMPAPQPKPEPCSPSTFSSPARPPGLVKKDDEYWHERRALAVDLQAKAVKAQEQKERTPPHKPSKGVESYSTPSAPKKKGKRLEADLDLAAGRDAETQVGPAELIPPSTRPARGRLGPACCRCCLCDNAPGLEDPPPFFATVLSERPELGPGVLSVQVPGGCVSGDAAIVKYKGRDMQIVVPTDDDDPDGNGASIFCIQWPFT